MFNVNFGRLYMQLLPTFLRQPVIYGILRAAQQRGLGATYNVFMKAREAHNYKLAHNGQVCYLRAALNDNFGGGFDILNVEREGEWLYAVTEKGTQIPVTFGEDGNARDVSNGKAIPILYSEAMLNAAQNSFIVTVPADKFYTNLPNIKAFVDKYKLCSKRAIYIIAQS